MHLVALVESERHVCCRYRLAAFRPLLAAAGHTLEFRPLPRRWFGRVSLGRGLAGADAVIVQRKLLPKWAAALLRSRVRDRRSYVVLTSRAVTVESLDDGLRRVWLKGGPA